MVQRLSRLLPIALIPSFACALLGLAARPAQAEPDTVFTLRALTVSVDFPCCNPDASRTQLFDTFANGDPLLGTAYTSTAGVSGTASYIGLNKGFSAGSEMTGPASDFYGTQFGVGGLQFHRVDAVPVPTNLDAPGTVSTANRLILRDPAGTPLLNQAQSFEVNTYWNFVTPEAGTGYGQRLSDNTQLTPTPGTPFDNQIDLRVIRGNDGSPIVQLRRQVYDGSVLSTQNFTLSVASALDSGWTLDDVALIEFNLHYNSGIPVVLATFNLSNAQGDDIGGRTFSQQLGIFSGEAFSHLSIGSFYVEAVPEPATLWQASLGLLALGAAALGRQRRRR